MNIIEIIFIGIGLASDACSVSIYKGLCMNKLSIYKMIIISLWFSIFQFIMPLIGYYFGNYIGGNLKVYSHIICFILLVLLGINMIRESSSIESDITDSISIKEMLILSIITSIDALSIGITFSLLNINIFISCIIIFIITFILSCIGIKIGYMFGSKYKSKTQIIGGVILIIMGIKFII